MRSNWDNGARRIEGVALGFEFSIYDMHDDCGRWAHLDINLLKINIEIGRYLGPTREPYTDDDKMILCNPDDLCEACHARLAQSVEQGPLKTLATGSNPVPRPDQKEEDAMT